MNRTKTLLATLALALPVPAVVAGCGGDDGGDEDPQAVLDSTFNNDTKIDSGVLDLSFDLSAEGDAGGGLTANITGPFAMNPDDPEGVGQLDLDIDISADGAAAAGFPGFQGGVTVTEDNLYVNYNDTDYELGTDQFNQLKEQAATGTSGAEGADAATSFREGCEQAIEAQGGDAAACDFDVTAWFTDLSNDGTEDKGGADATHISGNLNVEQMVSDLFALGSSVPGATGDVDPSVIEPQLQIIEDAVSDASFDVFSATEDDTLRGLDFTLGIDPTAIPGGEAAGVDSASLSFSFEISDVGSEQTFEAPADPQPIEDLAQDLGGIPGLGSSIPGGSGLPGADDPTGLGGTGGGNIDPDCLADAQTPDEIQACLEEPDVVSSRTEGPGNAPGPSSFWDGRSLLVAHSGK